MVTVLSRTGAQVIVDRLVCEGVSFAFGLCGHGNIGLLDALYDVRDRIHTVSVHHEQAAGHMADAYWRVAHRPAVTFTSCGPGSANIPVAIASAMMDSSALLAITANVPSVQFNRGAFQETYRHYQADFPSVLRPYVKRSFQPVRPEQLPLVMRQAFQVMLGGRPGPVQVDVPLDLFVETVDLGGERPQPVGETARVRSAAERGQLEAALGLLLGATRPVILAGGGAVLSEAEADVQALAERLGVPVVSTPLAAGVLPTTRCTSGTSDGTGRLRPTRRPGTPTCSWRWASASTTGCPAAGSPATRSRSRPRSSSRSTSTRPSSAATIP
jgi:acetolactate synthase-1/2/3 large subunit